MEEIDSFRDKKGRLIKILTDEEMFCFAFFDEKEIGKFEYEMTNDYIHIHHMNIEGDYQNNGIGKGLIKALGEFNGMPIIMPNPYEINRDAMYYLIDDGPCFKESCIRAGLVVGSLEEE